MMLRSILISVLLLSFKLLNAQQIDWNALAGKWDCEKVVLASKTDPLKKNDSIDISSQYKPYHTIYSPNLNYTEKFPAGNSITIGKYALNKTKNKISFSGMVQTIKFIGKVAVPDMVIKTGKQDFIVLKLSSNNLVVVEKFLPKSESQGDYIFYFKRMK